MADLINEVNLAEVGFPWTDEAEVRADLTAPGHEAANDLLLFGSDERLDAYLTMTPDDGDGVAMVLAFVRPSLWGRGLSAHLLSLGEDRVRTKARIVRLACWQSNERATRLFTTLGYTYVRTFHVMRIDFSGPVELPSAPDGIAIRTFDSERDPKAVHAMLVEAFADHWGGSFEPFDRWVHAHIEGESAAFDPNLWFVAVDGDAVAGTIACQERQASDPNVAYVSVLGVRLVSRGRGIGRALLLNAFAAVTARGVSSLELGVDSSNETGALRLYEDVGMHVKHSFEFWDKSL